MLLETGNVALHSRYCTEKLQALLDYFAAGGARLTEPKNASGFLHMMKLNGDAARCPAIPCGVIPPCLARLAKSRHQRK